MHSSAPHPVLAPELLALDTPESLAQISQPLTPTAGGQARARTILTIDGVHCAACIITIEAALAPLVESVNVNAATRRASLVFWPDSQPLSGIFATLRALGYGPRPVSHQALQAASQAGRRSALWRMLVAVLCMMQVMMYAMPRYVAGDGDMPPDIHRLLIWAEWVLTLPVLIFSTWPFFSGAWRDMRHRRIGMDVPVALGLAVMFAASSLAMTGDEALGEPVWFDSITMFAAFLLVGRWLEAAAREKALSGLADLLAALPRTVVRESPAGVQERVALESLRAGDQVILAAGEVIPADSVVNERETQVDESALTGESRPVIKPPGSPLHSGTVLLTGPARLIIRRAAHESRAREVSDLIAAASATRPQWARWADRWAGPFLVTVIVLAGAAAALWSVLDPSRAITIAASVLIVTCPCALSIAAPAAMLAGSTALARQGILLRSPDALESMAGIDWLLLDKTGTLTEPRPALHSLTMLTGSLDPELQHRTRALRTGSMHAGAADPEFGLDSDPDFGLNERFAIGLAAAAEQHSLHPIADALRQAAQERLTDAQRSEWAASVQEVAEHPGLGLSGLWTGPHDAMPWRLGTPEFILGSGKSVGSSGPAPGHAGDPGHTGDPTGGAVADDHTNVWLSLAGHPIARFALAQALRPRTEQAMDALRAQGLHLAIRSGDQTQAVRSVAERLHIQDWAARQSPQDKLEDLSRLQAQGHRVGLVGDGLNDAAALARADLSISFAHASGLAQQQADVLLLGGTLEAIPQARDHAQQCLRVVQQNLIFAAVYNLTCIPMALAGWMPPWLAGLGMATSSLLVVLNSLRLSGGVRPGRPITASVSA